jgi:hypothetical protein
MKITDTLYKNRYYDAIKSLRILYYTTVCYYSMIMPFFIVRKVGIAKLVLLDEVDFR